MHSALFKFCRTTDLATAMQVASGWSRDQICIAFEPNDSISFSHSFPPVAI
jgi:hypothetical protein